jgi:hypothetical protein
MIKPIPEQSKPTPKADAAIAARRLRPAQAVPAQRDPRADGCIDERLSITASCCWGMHCSTNPFAGGDDA